MIEPHEYTKEAIKHVNATPDDDYPLRILRAYRENCNVKFATTSDGSSDSLLLDVMNDMNDKRAAILDRAIAALELVNNTEFHAMIDELSDKIKSAQAQGKTHIQFVRR